MKTSDLGVFLQEQSQRGEEDGDVQEELQKRQLNTSSKDLMLHALLETNHPLINKSQEEVQGYQPLGQLFHAHQLGRLLSTGVEKQDPALVFVWASNSNIPCLQAILDSSLECAA